MNHMSTLRDYIGTGLVTLIVPSNFVIQAGRLVEAVRQILS